MTNLKEIKNNFGYLGGDKIAHSRRFVPLPPRACVIQIYSFEWMNLVSPFAERPENLDCCNAVCVE